MTSFRYFADLPNGEVVQFAARREPTFVDRMGCQRFRVVEPRVGLMLRTYPTVGAGNELCGYIEGKGWAAITRKVMMVSTPSGHDCDARCMNASGRNMACECACGGKNHGRGSALVCEAA